jgi:hypothetical protein
MSAPIGHMPPEDRQMPRSLRGDPRGLFLELSLSYAAYLFDYAQELLRERPSAAEAVEYALSTAIGQFDHATIDAAHADGSLRLWLYATVRRECAATLADQDPDDQDGPGGLAPWARQGDDVSVPGSSAASEVVDDALTAEYLIPELEAEEHRRDVTVVSQVVSCLDDSDIEILSLAVRHNLDDDGVAAVLGITPNAAGSDLSEAAERFDHLAAALVLLHAGWSGCKKMDGLVGGSYPALPSSDRLARRITKHAKSCAICGQIVANHGFGPELLSVLPVPRLPPAVDRWLRRVASSPDADAAGEFRPGRPDRPDGAGRSARPGRAGRAGRPDFDQEDSDEEDASLGDADPGSAQSSSPRSGSSDSGSAAAGSADSRSSDPGHSAPAVSSRGSAKPPARPVSGSSPRPVPPAMPPPVLPPVPPLPVAGASRPGGPAVPGSSRGSRASGPPTIVSPSGPRVPGPPPTGLRRNGAAGAGSPRGSRATGPAVAGSGGSRTTSAPTTGPARTAPGGKASGGKASDSKASDSRASGGAVAATAALAAAARTGSPSRGGPNGPNGPDGPDGADGAEGGTESQAWLTRPRAAVLSVLAVAIIAGGAVVASRLASAADSDRGRSASVTSTHAPDSQPSGTAPSSAQPSGRGRASSSAPASTGNTPVPAASTMPVVTPRPFKPTVEPSAPKPTQTAPSSKPNPKPTTATPTPKPTSAKPSSSPPSPSSSPTSLPISPPPI